MTANSSTVTTTTSTSTHHRSQVISPALPRVSLPTSPRQTGTCCWGVSRQQSGCGCIGPWSSSFLFGSSDSYAPGWPEMKAKHTDVYTGNSYSYWFLLRQKDRGRIHFDIAGFIPGYVKSVWICMLIKGSVPDPCKRIFELNFHLITPLPSVVHIAWDTGSVHLNGGHRDITKSSEKCYPMRWKGFALVRGPYTTLIWNWEQNKTNALQQKQQTFQDRPSCRSPATSLQHTARTVRQWFRQR